MIRFKELLTHHKTLLAVKIILSLLVLIVLLTVLVLAVNAAINSRYQNVFLPGTKLGNVDIGNLSAEQARDKVQAQIDALNSHGFVYVAKDKKVSVLPIISSAESADISYPLVSWQLGDSLQAIKNWQADNSPINLLSKAAVWLGGKNWPVAYTWDREQHLKTLQDSLLGVLPAKQEASFSVEDSKLLVKPERVGQTFDYQTALEQTLPQIKYLGGSDIELRVIEDRPQITENIIRQWQERIIFASGRGSLQLFFEEDSWSVANDVWRQWLRLVKVKNQVQLVFDLDSFDKYLQEEGIKEAVEVPVQDAKFKLLNGRVSEFMASQQGRLINLEQTLSLAAQALQNSGDLKINLVTEVVEPKVMNSEVNDLGIATIVGIGSSDFKGSPVNRVHNIGVGAKTLDGLLISPGEEFSLITALGEIDGEHGYKQELVIKGNKTIPEYGGGLCQIGTTMFRAALGTGLPITERRNHSYRVVYYEPAGMDATIYSPKPDLKFINDTGNYILIQSRIEGTKLYFDFWGTSDGRVASTTKPIIYNQVAPPPKKLIKTTELAVGITKCTESAHAGADTKFDYIVQYPNQPEPVKVTFSSHYVPWQSVCLVGATQEEIDAEQNGGAATSTDPLVPPAAN